MAGQSGVEIGDARGCGRRSLQLHVMETPCRNQCALDAARAFCTGCGRTTDEIVHWRSIGNDARAAVMARVKDWVPLRGP
ncbi:DUF1289 domain-containing protein [Sphingobium sp.]|uniref:DUF1289 domain-containing protein n=1 Tax=Sphingobium sp. TaxID=1912891 RepID=UPI003BB6344F